MAKGARGGRVPGALGTRNDVFKSEPMTEKVLSWLPLQAPALISCVPLGHHEPSLMIRLPFWGPGSNKPISKAAHSRHW